jgi:hypothetical protein
MAFILRLLLPLVAPRQWRTRRKPDEPATLPKWMAAIDSFTFAKAVGLAFVLAAVNPKNLLLCAATGTAIGGSRIGVGEMVLAIAVITVIAASSVAVPVLAILVAHERMAKPLDESGRGSRQATR